MPPKKSELVSILCVIDAPPFLFLMKWCKISIKSQARWCMPACNARTQKSGESSGPAWATQSSLISIKPTNTDQKNPLAKDSDTPVCIHSCLSREDHCVPGLDISLPVGRQKKQCIEKYLENKPAIKDFAAGSELEMSSSSWNCCEIKREL